MNTLKPSDRDLGRCLNANERLCAILYLINSLCRLMDESIARPLPHQFFFAADTFLNFTKKKSEKKVDTGTRDCKVKDFNISFEKLLFNYFHLIRKKKIFRFIFLYFENSYQMKPFHHLHQNLLMR